MLPGYQISHKRNLPFPLTPLLFANRRGARHPGRCQTLLYITRKMGWGLASTEDLFPPAKDKNNLCYSEGLLLKYKNYRKKIEARRQPPAHCSLPNHIGARHYKLGTYALCQAPKPYSALPPYLLALCPNKKAVPSIFHRRHGLYM